MANTKEINPSHWRNQYGYRRKKNKLFQKRKKSIVSLLLIVALAAPLSLALDPPQSLGGGPLPSSKLKDEALERIYKSSESVDIGADTIQPWKDSKAILKAVGDATEDIQIKGINGGLYLQYITSTDEEEKQISPFEEVITNHFFGGCAESARNEKGKGNCQADPLLQHGDIKLSTVLDGFVYNPDREILARLFVNNIVNPFPNETFRKMSSMAPERLKDPGVRRILANALADQAVFSVARQPFAEMIAKRKPVSNVGNKSMMEIMEKEAAQRFLNDGWQQKIKKGYEEALNSKTPSDAMLYEIARMEAYQSWMLYEHYRQMERVEALLSTLISIEMRQSTAAAGLVSSVQSSGKSSGQ